MRRADLEHVIRAAGAVVNSPSLVIIGSQAILGQFPQAPDVLLTSIEADLYPSDDPAKAEIIDGAIGEESPFHVHFGYYAHGVGPETAILPPDFQKRLIEVKNENTSGYTGLCLEVHDLMVSKLAAGRDKDLSFVKEVLRHKMVQPVTVKALVQTLAVDDEKKATMVARLKRLEWEAEAPTPPGL